MFQEIANRAQRAIDTLVSKYVTRLAVAVPFVVALGFGTAAASVKLTEMYGSMLANALLAGVFATFGLVRSTFRMSKFQVLWQFFGRDTRRSFGPFAIWRLGFDNV